MNPDLITVPPSISVEQLVEDYIYKHHFKMFPVLKGGSKLVGCVSTKQVRDIPKKEWKDHTVGEIAVSCSIENTIGPDEDAVKALTAMNRTGESRLMVVKGDRLLGLVSLKDLMKFLSLKLDLEGEEG
jgi:CBS domain-containing protein